MQIKTPGSQSIRAFTRALRSFLEEEVSSAALGQWQKHLLSEGLWEYGTYVRQVKKLDRTHWAALRESLSQGQIESKLWLYQVLGDVLPQGSYHFSVGGGWTGVTSLLGLWSIPERIQDMTSFDIDPQCADIAMSVNEPYSWNGKFRAEVRDLNNFKYSPHQPSILINTICEHQENFRSWFENIPSGQFVVLQNNNFLAGRDHVNCVQSLLEFEQQAPLATTLFSGELDLFDYKRFMLIGIK